MMLPECYLVVIHFLNLIYIVPLVQIVIKMYNEQRSYKSFIG